MIALVTEKGQPGAPTILDAERWGFNQTQFQGLEIIRVRGFGSWVIEIAVFKVFPMEGHAISVCWAALLLSKRLTTKRGSPELEIERVLIGT